MRSVITSSFLRALTFRVRTRAKSNHIEGGTGGQTLLHQEVRINRCRSGTRCVLPHRSQVVLCRASPSAASTPVPSARPLVSHPYPVIAGSGSFPLLRRSSAVLLTAHGLP